MLFNSALFVLLYLPVVWTGYLLSLRLPWAQAGIVWLGIASLLFYVYWNPAFLPLLLASTLFNYAVGLILNRSFCETSPLRRKVLLFACIGVNLGTLVYYKYANFLSSSLHALTGVAAPVFDIVLPLGISFYTFTQIAYVVDSYSSRKAEKSFSAYLLFVTFFPHLIAGPVLHHSEMMPQFLRDQKNAMRITVIMEGMLFFACGLAKKVVIADSIAPAANRVFLLAESNMLGFMDSWFGVLAYTTQIYFDFSGYSDMAIGLALLFGIRLPLNFNSPYKSISIIEFWRRWHMTLSRFLRDYIYIPLGGNRNGKWHRHANLMLTMLLGGLWHGASWTFLVWGALHGIYLQINHGWRHVVKRSPVLQRLLATHTGLASLVSWTLTFLAVSLAWVFFRAESFSGAANLLESMFTGHSSINAPLVDMRTTAYLLIGLSLAFFSRNSQELLTGTSERIYGRWPILNRPFFQGSHIASLLFVIAALTMISVSWGTNEFIYFNY